MNEIMHAAQSAYQFIMNWDYLIVILACSIFIFLMAKRKSYHSHSFKMRSSLNSIYGYAKILNTGKVGVMTPEQQGYLYEIMASTELVRKVIDDIEREKLSTADRDTSYDLRSAIMSINGYCDLLENSKPALTSSQRECIGYIASASKDIIRGIS